MFDSKPQEKGHDAALRVGCGAVWPCSTFPQVLCAPHFPQHTAGLQEPAMVWFSGSQEPAMSWFYGLSHASSAAGAFLSSLGCPIVKIVVMSPEPYTEKILKAHRVAAQVDT